MKDRLPSNAHLLWRFRASENVHSEKHYRSGCCAFCVAWIHIGSLSVETSLTKVGTDPEQPGVSLLGMRIITGIAIKIAGYRPPWRGTFGIVRSYRVPGSSTENRGLLDCTYLPV